MTNLAENLAATVSEHGERVAIKLDDVKLNYGFVDEVAARAAGMLKAAGIEGGDRAVQLAAAVVGDDHRPRSVVHRAHGIIRVQDTFGDHWQ